jgi:hypothetical protein
MPFVNGRVLIREWDNSWLGQNTCCIDKRSSAELSEAINSMWKWYQKSEVCYAYLADVSIAEFVPPEGENDVLSKNRWFTRGWT